ncbi:MAG: DNA repair protein [Actinomycetota bacterium]|nr:DNA repair protein [Actinomycetota bacterium]
MGPDRLHFTRSDAANLLIARDPMALLIGFVLDQQVTVPKAFMGPLVLRDRLGSIDPATLATADLERVFRERPAIHRYPGVMAGRVRALAVHILEEYDGDPARVWTTATDAARLRRNVEALPGFGEMKTASLGAVLAGHYGIELAAGLRPGHPTLADVDSAEALAGYQATKRVHRKEWDKIRAAERAARG